MEAQKLALEKTPGLGQRIDIVLTLIRLGLFFGNQDVITTNLAKAEEYVVLIIYFWASVVEAWICRFSQARRQRWRLG